MCPKPLGKLASRLEEVKNPWRQVSTLELSHNEAARLATDALLELGEKEYRRVLAEERELNFLSPLEIRYIGQHAASRTSPDGNGAPGAADRDFGDGDAVSELTSGTYFPMMSDEEPPMLELGWPESPARYGPSETQIYFQRDKSHNIKDLIRSLINKVIAVVMDVFTDVDLLCDLMEASNKRRVPVYILLDEKNLGYFSDMCSALDIQNSHLSNMRIRSVCGDTYCTKSGKKFSGQVLEKFMIIDSNQPTIKQPANQLTNPQSDNQPANQPTIKQRANQLTNPQSNNQLTNPQSNNQLTNPQSTQPANQPTISQSTANQKSTNHHQLTSPQATLNQPATNSQLLYLLSNVINQSTTNNQPIVDQKPTNKRQLTVMINNTQTTC
uniref:Family with sequence similarity 83 member C n=1 Tax=Acanthochromis polyacanthus TaxID=80966 RepID=A0A3Q1ENN6_9TELE